MRSTYMNSNNWSKRVWIRHRQVSDALSFLCTKLTVVNMHHFDHHQPVITETVLSTVNNYTVSIIIIFNSRLEAHVHQKTQTTTYEYTQ